MLKLLSCKLETISLKTSVCAIAFFRRTRSSNARSLTFLSNGSIFYDKNQFRNSTERRYSTVFESTARSGRIISKKESSIFYESRRFKGHAHWQNVARTKQAKDAMKSHITNRLILRINRCLSRTREPNPRFNKELANILDECAANNIPKDTIKRALDRAANAPPTLTQVFGICGRSGIYLVVEVETASRNKTKNQIYKICAKLGDFGVTEASQNRLEGFQETGVVRVFKDSSTAKAATTDSESESAKIEAAPPLTLNDAETLAIELECEEVREVEEDKEQGTASSFEFTCASENVDRVAGALRTRGYVVQSADSEYVPYPALVKVTPQLEQSVRNLYQKLEEIEGLGRIFDNVDWDEPDDE